MAVNENVVYATKHTYARRQDLQAGRAALRVACLSMRFVGAVEQGMTTNSHAAAERAQRAEQERQADVNRQIMTRSEKREVDRQHGREVVQMPDGSFRLRD